MKLIAENQQLSGFSGRITREIAEHRPDMQRIAESARRFDAQLPGQVKRSPKPRITKFGDGRNGKA
jgi:hypothetical protein